MSAVPRTHPSGPTAPRNRVPTPMAAFLQLPARSPGVSALPPASGSVRAERSTSLTFFAPRWSLGWHTSPPCPRETNRRDDTPSGAPSCVPTLGLHSDPAAGFARGRPHEPSDRQVCSLVVILTQLL